MTRFFFSHQASRQSVAVALLAIAILFPGRGAAEQVAANAQPVGVSEAPSKAAAQSQYRFGVADKVRIIVFNEPTLSGEFLVSSDGSLSLPLIGTVPVQGKTSAEVIKDITARYSDGYLRDPQISMDVLTYRPFYILGEVEKPGEYPYSNGLTVLNAVATAQGFTYRASKGKVFIKHAGETDEHKYKLAPGLLVQPGDTVRIGERYF